MRTNLKIPFAEKDEAKKLGARWDGARKIWYVDDKLDMAPFSRWSPTPHEVGGDEAVPKGKPAPRQQTTGKVIVGSAYVEQTKVCECLPWELCEKCEPMALSRQRPD